MLDRLYFNGIVRTMDEEQPVKRSKDVPACGTIMSGKITYKG